MSRAKPTIHVAPVLLLLAPLLAAGCSSPEGYPSLARRPAEFPAGTQPPPCARASGEKADGGRVTGCGIPVAATPQPAPVPPLAPSGTDSQLPGLVMQARTAHARFAAKVAQTERLVAAGSRAAVASDAWSAAQVALGELDSAHTATAAVLSQLDSLYAADSIAHPAEPGPDSAAIAAAREEVMALDEQERAVLDRLAGRLPG